MADRGRETFGVSAILEEGCTVFYATLFSPKQLGRVSDLLAARLQQSQVDDLRLRALLLFGAYEAFRSRGGEGAQDPLSIEVGVEADRMAVGVSFVLDEARIAAIVDAEFAQRVLGGESATEFESLLLNLCRHSRSVHLKVQPSRKRVELVSVIGVPEAGVGTPALEVVILGDSLEEAPAPAEYIEIGDLDYAALLREGGPQADVGSLKTGKLLVESLDSRRVAGANPLTDEGTRVEGVTDVRTDEAVEVGGSKDSVESSRVSGDREEIDRHKVVIRGSKSDPRSSYQNRINGTSASDQANGLKIAVQSQEIEEYQRRIAELELQLAGRAANVGAAGEANPGEADGSGAMPAPLIAPVAASGTAEGETIAEKIRRLLGIGRKGDAKEKEAVADGAGVALPLTTDPTIVAIANAQLSPEDGADSAGAVARQMAIQAVALDQRLAHVMNEAAHLKGELGSSNAKRFVDGMISDLVSEKSRLNELAKQLNTSVRQKELEFKNRERTLQEELKHKEEQLRTKNVAISRLKDQMAQVSLTVERMKSAGGAGTEESHLKQRLAQSQRLLQVSKDENLKLKSKVDELKSSLSSAQLSMMSNQSSKGPSQQEFAAIQHKYTQTQRLADEFKRQNSMLLEKLERKERELKERPAAALGQDVRKRLEGAMQLITATRKEADQMRLRIEELTREEARLRQELERARRDGGGNGSQGSGNAA